MDQSRRKRFLKIRNKYGTEIHINLDNVLYIRYDRSDNVTEIYLAGNDYPLRMDGVDVGDDDIVEY